MNNPDLYPISVARYLLICHLLEMILLDQNLNFRFSLPEIFFLTVGFIIAQGQQASSLSNKSLMTNNPKEQGRTAQASLKAMNAAQKKAEQLGKNRSFEMHSYLFVEGPSVPANSPIK